MRQDVENLQDQAYDLLGDMLAERHAARYIQALAEDVAQGRTGDMDAYFARQGPADLKAIQAYSRRQRRRRFLGRTLPRVARAAAALIAVVSLAGGVAVATSSTVRVQVMRLLLQVEEEYSALSLAPDTDAALNVPAGWTGSSFPAYIPEGLELAQTFCMGGYALAEYRSEATGEICLSFSEAGADTKTNIDTENAAITPILIQGYTGYLVEKKDNVTLFWADGQSYFVLIMQDATSDEALQVAQSMQRIQ